MTVSQIKNGLLSTLTETFPNYPAKGEGISQGLDPPVFYVAATSARQSKELGCRRRRTAEFDVQYLPADSTTKNDALYEMGETLLELFEYVETVDGTLRPVSLGYEIEDEVLHCRLSFQWFVRLASETPATIANIELEVT
ncbi:MAG: hypothetical protein H6Q60_1415 [Oscillospiraceae bacterium]|nr:hypothetical protein [Oscillospiraceae bacterium]